MGDEQVVERQRKRAIRGSILRALAVGYGTNFPGFGFESIRHVARKGTDKELREELQYLFDLGYVAIVQEKRDALDEDPPISYRLQAKGRQVLNGDLEDRSIEL